MQTQKEILEKIDKLFKDPKSKGFIGHLLKAFFPLDKPKYMLDNSSKKKMQCCLTGVTLVSKWDILSIHSGISEEVLSHTMSRMLSKLSGEEIEPQESPLKKALAGRAIAIEVPDSDKLLSPLAMQALVEYKTNLIFNDPNNRRDHFQPSSIPSGAQAARTKIKELNKAEMKTTLGDLSALQALKEKMDSKNEA